MTTTPTTEPTVSAAQPRVVDRSPWTIERLAATDGVFAVMVYTRDRGYEHAGETDKWRSTLLAAEEFVNRFDAKGANADIQIIMNAAQRVRVVKIDTATLVVVHASNCKATKAMPRTLQRIFANTNRDKRPGRPPKVVTT